MGKAAGRKPGGRQSEAIPAPGADLEQARELVRELHEAIKGGRELLRDLKAVHAKIGADAETAAAEIIGTRIEKAGQAAGDRVRRVAEGLEEANVQMLEQAAQIAKMATPGEFVRKVAGEVFVLADVAVETCKHMDAFRAADSELNRIEPRRQWLPGPARRRVLAPGARGPGLSALAQAGPGIRGMRAGRSWRPGLSSSLPARRVRACACMVSVPPD